MKSVLSMLNLKYSVEVEGGFFFSFLEANHASVVLQAEEYERRARDILLCMFKTVELAQPVFEQLKKTNYESFNEFERGRYDKAAAHHQELIEQRLDIPRYRKRTGMFA